MSILGSIDTLIAFVTVMLLFSLLVTGLVQATQSFVRLRGRNLRVALTQMLSQWGIANENSARDLVDRILDARVLLPKHTPLLVRAVPKSIRGTGASRIEENELRFLLEKEADLPPAGPASRPSHPV